MADMRSSPDLAVASPESPKSPKAWPNYLGLGHQDITRAA
jgi:hypothetical protein